MYRRRWKPNAAQRKAYAEKMREAEENYDFIVSNGAIREGCYVIYIDKATCTKRYGEVINDSYGSSSGQHTFTILHDGYEKVLVKGRNLYDRLLKHIQGEKSKQTSRY